MPSYALAGVSTHELIRRLRSIRSVEGGKYDLLTHAAKLDDIQLLSLPRQAIKDLSASEVDISSENIGQDADQTWRDLGSNGTTSIQIFRWKMLPRLGNESDHWFPCFLRSQSLTFGFLDLWEASRMESPCFAPATDDAGSFMPYLNTTWPRLP